MLSGLVEALAGDGGRLSLLSRNAGAYRAAPVMAFDCDYRDEAAFASALDDAVGRSGPIDLAVAWFHDARLPAVRRLAERIGATGQPGRLFQVLGSATADPARPDRLAIAASVAEGLPNCRLRQVILGFEIGKSGSRWLSDTEISGGVLAAVRSDAEHSIVGRVEPWSARP